MTKRISTLTEFITAVGPHLSSHDPVASLTRAGVEMDPSLADALAKARPGKTFDPEIFKRLRATYGPPPPIRLRIGRADLEVVVGSFEPPALPPPAPSGYGGVGSIDLRVVNDILAELWKVGTIPRAIDTGTTAMAINIDELRSACTGVPDDATTTTIVFPSPPTISASAVTPLNAHVDVPFDLQTVGPGLPSLMGVLRLELPLDFLVDAFGKIRLQSGAITELQGVLEVAPWSAIQPRPGSPLQEKLVAAARALLLYEIYSKGLLTFSVSIPISKSFPNSTVDIVQLGAVTARAGATDYLTVGINVESLHAVDRAALATQATPVAPDTLNAMVDESFATDALSAVISSGDLAAFINRVADRHAHVNVASVRIDSGRVTFEQGQLNVSLECTAVDACAFGKDLGFTATVSGTPTIENGTLAIEASEIDIDLDNIDAVLCTILSLIYGPFGLLITVGVLAFLAAFNPNAKDVDIPAAETTEPLPGSDKVVDVALTRATMAPGVLSASGYIRLVADQLHLFAHLRVVEGMSPVMSRPLVGASVDLFELDSPAPAGDDVSIPEGGDTEKIVGRIETTTSTTYSPRADQLLGTRTTDANGYVRFVALCNAIGGTATEYKTTENLQTGHITTSRRTWTIGEPSPDLGVTIRTATGDVVATRRLVGMNVPGKRLGTPDQPVIVRVELPHPVAIADS